MIYIYKLPFNSVFPKRSVGHLSYFMRNLAANYTTQQPQKPILQRALYCNYAEMLLQKLIVNESCNIVKLQVFQFS